MKEYIMLRDEAVLECNIEKLEELMKQYNPLLYLQFKDADKIVKIATLQKMACNITTMPKWRKDSAKEWLRNYGMSDKLNG